MPTPAKSQFEFIALMASLMSVVALSIDALLPALPNIADALHIVQYQDTQLLVTMIFLGLGFGQLLAGPLSDSLGRKPLVYGGFVLFMLASFICVSAQSLELMLMGRILQGVGLAAPRTVSIAIVRDSFKGDYMAKIMSFVTVIFIIVPAVAPSLGKFLLDRFGWESIFHSQLLIALAIVVWFFFRQEETLKKADRIPFKMNAFYAGAKAFINDKQAVIYTLVSGFITGSFMVYLSTAQKIFGEQYGLVDEFPMFFAIIAVTVGVSTFFNGMLVVRYGMKQLVRIAILGFTVLPLSYIALFYASGNPDVKVLLGFFMLVFLAIGFLFGNIQAIALEHLGHIAGIGSAISGFVSTIIAVPIAAFMGSFVDQTALPLFVGFSICGALALLLLWYKRVLDARQVLGLVK